ncbi:MAG: MBL fold metallo-hydrolase [Chitinophagales bacterium]|jgi:phosphoribosyl 1,2-cyclic phosphate phosphodiesterase|nr:MBL fold metallo-hydrolase [Sphingobacteriales bacterium]
MENKLIFLGTGTSVGVPMVGCPCEVCQSDDQKDKRLRTSAMIQFKDRNLLIDIGPDFRAQMLFNSITRIDAVFLTHPHRDHVAGFDEIRALNFLYETKVDLYANAFTWDSLKKQFYYAFMESEYTSVPKVEYSEIKNAPIRFQDIDIIPVQVSHGKMPCLGYRIGDLAYITDANAIADKEMEKLQNLEVLVLNALRKYHHPSHFTLEESLEIVAKLKPKKAFFTHLSHHMGKHVDVERELPENVFIGYDGLQVRF